MKFGRACEVNSRRPPADPPSCKPTLADAVLSLQQKDQMTFSTLMARLLLLARRYLVADHLRSPARMTNCLGRFLRCGFKDDVRHRRGQQINCIAMIAAFLHGERRQAARLEYQDAMVLRAEARVDRNRQKDSDRRCGAVACSNSRRCAG